MSKDEHAYRNLVEEAQTIGGGIGFGGDLRNRFRYHKPGEEVEAKHERVRDWLFNIAAEMDKMLPNSREKSTCITKLEEAMFWANAAIARNQK